MYTLYTYSRKRLFASSFQRDQFISVLVKRTLKSIARSTGGRIHTNKWMKLIDSLVASSPSDHGPLLLTQILEQIKKYEKTQKQTCLRIEFLMDYIAARRLTYLDINKLFDRFKPRFEAMGMRDWLIECAHRNDLFIADCGHFESGRNIQYIQGNADTFDFTEAHASLVRSYHLELTSALGIGKIAGFYLALRSNAITDTALQRCKIDALTVFSSMFSVRSGTHKAGVLTQTS